MRLFNFLAVATVLFMAPVAEAQLTKRGDAETRGSGVFRVTKLPFFSLGKKGTYDYKVSGLKKPAFPHKMEIRSSRAINSFLRDRPFEDAVVKVQILSMSGAVLSTTTVRPKTTRFEGNGEFDQYFSVPKTGGGTDYRVRVTVLQVSDREWDKARIFLR